MLLPQPLKEVSYFFLHLFLRTVLRFYMNDPWMTSLLLYGLLLFYERCHVNPPPSNTTFVHHGVDWRVSSAWRFHWRSDWKVQCFDKWQPLFIHVGGKMRLLPTFPLGPSGNQHHFRNRLQEAGTSGNWKGKGCSPPGLFQAAKAQNISFLGLQFLWSLQLNDTWYSF